MRFLKNYNVAFIPSNSLYFKVKWAIHSTFVFYCLVVICLLTNYKIA